ncbi:MAG: Gx transporter family protein [Selenomonadaceae bacterium]|nr:Gx transporter family protein [Selenomonadaceae bacterium]
MRRYVILSQIVAFSLALFLLESMIPLPFMAPGAKLGLSQIATVFTLYYFSSRDAFIVLTARAVLSSFFFGGPGVFVYSIIGGLISLCGMIILKRTGKFSCVSVSATGGFLHNLGQLFVASIFMESAKFFYYLPILGVIGVATGIVIGFIANELLKKIKLTKFDNSGTPPYPPLGGGQ